MPNNDLISRKALYAAWDKIDEMEFNDPNLRIDEMIRLTQDAPAVDAEPVRHGKWEIINRNEALCSECKMIRSIGNQEGWNYCPTCGAKMEKEKT